MYSRDYILKLVQQFAQVLARIAGYKEKGEPGKAIELINETYAGLLKLDRKYLLGLKPDDTVAMLIQEYHLTLDQLDILAKLMVEDADLDAIEKKNLCSKALLILAYLNKEQKVYSFEREALMEDIRKRLN
ncbi:MAG: hypothetical protein QM731_08210 [Chitinophagaceae bacterium]